MNTSPPPVRSEPPHLRAPRHLTAERMLPAPWRSRGICFATGFFIALTVGMLIPGVAAIVLGAH